METTETDTEDNVLSELKIISALLRKLYHLTESSLMHQKGYLNDETTQKILERLQQRTSMTKADVMAFLCCSYATSLKVMKTLAEQGMVKYIQGSGQTSSKIILPNRKVLYDGYGNEIKT